ncbi:MAG: response regulator, partial [Caldilineaceae bacterium]|nr:response regulator [Caldilineaceae bacterium]
MYTDVVTDTQSATRRILVVDDQSIIRSLLEEVLAQKGYTVITASNGKDALEAVRQGGLPDL